MKPALNSHYNYTKTGFDRLLVFIRGRREK